MYLVKLNIFFFVQDSEQTVNVKQEVLPDQRGTRQPKQNDSPQPGIGSFSQHARGSSQQPESSSRQGSSSQQSVSSSKQLTSSVQQSGSSNQQSVSSTQHLGNSSQQRSSTQQPVSSSQQSGSSSSWPRRSSQVQDNARPKIKGELWSFSKEKLDDASLKVRLKLNGGRGELIAQIVEYFPTLAIENYFVIFLFKNLALPENLFFICIN